ncbi:MAG: RecQ family zinc-binding domain-containing protein, partial [Bacteroidales bacterium]|nr:RecQ family zinc-binding domain-containing protein [Bacteroidales bacterium]
EMLASRQELYGIRLGSADLDNFIQTLMRLYTGLFSGYLDIDEEKIANVGRYSPLVVESYLKRLSAKGVLKYIPKVKSPILYTSLERLYEKNLRLPQSEYNLRTGRAMERTEAMISYVREDRCRSRMLLEYFGQHESRDCGSCDICLKKGRR